MAFLNGRVSYIRYQVGGDAALPWADDVIERLSKFSLSERGADPKDGTRFGWGGGHHVLDASFDPAKNLIEDVVHAAIVIETDKIPADLLKAYITIEEQARARTNPSGFPTKAQREEAREAARQRADTEASDGRYRKRKSFPVLWDGQSNWLYAGSSSAAVLDRLRTLFRETFDRELTPISAGWLAAEQAGRRGQSSALDLATPRAFNLDQGQTDGENLLDVVWSSIENDNHAFLGNEFLVWMWHILQTQGDAIDLADGSEVSVMMAKTLVLDCPRGQTGRDQLTDEGPTRLPEAMRALQSGKMPRRVGLMLTRHGVTYDLTLQAESLAVSGLAIPKAEGASGIEAKIARIESLRHVVETLDLLYDAFGRHRLSLDWNDELGKIRRWLQAA